MSEGERDGVDVQELWSVEVTREDVASAILTKVYR